MTHRNRDTNIKTNTKKRWLYDEYYMGGKDEEGVREGQGENKWSRPEFMDSYVGRFTRDAMHGCGDYRWRYRPRPRARPNMTYEGHVYANSLHGCGLMSYDDGQVFRGIFYKNHRFGPGVESTLDLHADVGLWLGRRLLRLAWQPPGTPPVPDVTPTPISLAAVVPHRVKLRTKRVYIGDENSAADLLMSCGASEEQTEQNWRSLYSSRCTDPESAFFEKSVFDSATFGDNYEMLDVAEITDNDINNMLDEGYKVHNSWNNSEDITEMMRHSFQYASMCGMANINVSNILSGKRRAFRSAGAHELDCRAALLASYLGSTPAVAELINDRNVHPDVSDCKGNTALMYACCADQHETISFLLCAGASVDRSNDACLTPLAMCLLRRVAARRDASVLQFAKLFMPEDFLPSDIDSICTEWNITRNLASDIIPRQKSKLRAQSAKKITRSTQSLLSRVSSARLAHKSSISKPSSTCPEPTYDSEDDTPGVDADKAVKEKHSYFTFLREYRYSELQAMAWADKPNLQYAFDVDDIVEEFDIEAMSIFMKPAEANQKSTLGPPKKAAAAKPPQETKKVTIKRSKDVLWQNISDNDDVTSLTSSVRMRVQKLTDIKLTTLQLLSSGAKPSAVTCPMPLLAVAMFTNSPLIVKKLVECGADVNETFPQLRCYKAVDVALSQPLSLDCLEMVRALLESGADVQHRLPYVAEVGPSEVNMEDAEDCGPTLLHVVVAKNVDNDTHEEIQRRLLEVLLEHGADATALFVGRSAFDYAVEKDITLVDTFIRNPKADLNLPINAHGQNILTKLFSATYFKQITQVARLHMGSLLLIQLTGLLLHGADPLLQCRSVDDHYQNLFVFAQHQLQMFSADPGETTASKGNVSKQKKVAKQVNENDAAADVAEDYKQALELATECARILHIRWLRAKILKNLINVVYRFKHRAWHMIVKEHKFPKETGLWLTSQQALEIWDILKLIKQTKYKNDEVLNKVLCIIQYYHRLPFLAKLTMKENDAIISDVKSLIKEHKMAAPDAMSWSKYYVKPELSTVMSKYYVCFECGIPLPKELVTCVHCHLVSFCCEECLQRNVQRYNCHPCSALMSRQTSAGSVETIASVVVDSAL